MDMPNEENPDQHLWITARVELCICGFYIPTKPFAHNGCFKNMYMLNRNNGWFFANKILSRKVCCGSARLIR